MDYLHFLILGLVQGLTEFLPISSSAHLILLPKIAGWQDQGLAYDVFAHLGSLIAIVIYFWNDLLRILPAWAGSLRGRPVTHDVRLCWYLLIGTVPIAIAGLLFYEFVSTEFRSPLLIACTSVVFALLLWWSDVAGKRLRNESNLLIKDAVWIGMAQALALVPGTSRSGITMTAALVLGLDRKTAGRFSFLLALPAIALAGGHEMYRYFQLGTETDPVAFILVLVSSAFSSWCAIKFFLTLIERTGMLPYVIYRLLLGVVLFYLFL
ncbi:MAG: undecaprenyl-diphosphate phosphatase [Gammaproteobacteria bacterium]|nr:undecaprenyl-diphosphate phosphatase [Gammaproteobacteria bacterium]